MVAFRISKSDLDRFVRWSI